MKIAVFSDSHGNLNDLQKAAEKATTEGAELFIHLGDDYQDARILENEVITSFVSQVIKVPGVYDQEYTDYQLPHRIIKEFEKVKILITHTPSSHENDFSSDFKPEEVSAKKEVKVILYGHTHIPKIEEKDGIYWINPGHLKKEDKKGYPPSFALLEITNGEIKPKIINLR